MCQLTVAICTYNGAERLPQVLDSLRSQIYPTDLTWEVVVIDNNSSDRTADIVHDCQRQWPETPALRYCLETKQGLAHARQRAVEIAKGNWVGFLDDDNVPASNWIAAVQEFSQTHPQAGVFGSRILGRYEVTPPEGFDRIRRFLAINPSKKLICYSDPTNSLYHKHIYPPGAGAVINRQAWLDCVPDTLTLQGRVSGLCLPGEDVEAFTYLRKAGLEVWYNPSMEIEHLIPQQRLEADYLYQLLWRTGLSRYHTRRLAYSAGGYVLMVVPYGFNDIFKLIQHCWRYSPWPKDVVSQGERLLLLGSFISPLYFLRWAFLSFFEQHYKDFQSIFVMHDNQQEL